MKFNTLLLWFLAGLVFFDRGDRGIAIVIWVSIVAFQLEYWVDPKGCFITCLTGTRKMKA